MVNIEIDGINIQAKEGAMIIEAADDAGVPIPRFCYHKKLSVAANCRMCLVEVEKAAKPLPACATPITEGMRVFTKSARAIDAQKGVMEFLLINHPLDCPICDQGGECDLQDLAMGYGSDHSRFSEGKRVVKDKDIGPLIATDMTRCIHCTRCVRFGEEIAGLRELGATGRGEHMRIGTYIEKAVSSELSGNVIDLCPVGALTSKPFRFNARAWELNHRDGIAAHDCVGSNIRIDSLRSEVRRVVPIENERINETWISDRDRYSYEGANSTERLTVPMIREHGEWRETDWETALEVAVLGIKAVVKNHGPAQLGALVSPSATLEEMYLLQKLVRGLGSANIDHRLRQLDFSDQERMPLFPSLGLPIAELEELEAALVIGGNVRMDQPIIGHRLRKAALKGGRIMFINPVDYDVRYAPHASLVVAPDAMTTALAGVAKALLDSGASGPEGLAGLVQGVAVNDTHRAMAEALRNGSRTAVLLGLGAQTHPAAATLRALAQAIAQMTGSSCGELTLGANAAGAWQAGAVPHRGAAAKGATFGLDARAMVESSLRGYLLFGIEPEFDCGLPALALRAVEGAEFVACFTPFKSEAMLRYANVLLPVAPFTETSGTFVNVEGRWQGFAGAVKPRGEARPGWKVLRVLGNLLRLSGFEHVSSDEVREELRAELTDVTVETAWRCPAGLGERAAGLQRLADLPIYAVDAVVRRALPLQQTVQGRDAVVHINSRTAVAQGLEGAVAVVVRQGNDARTLPLEIDDSVADGTVWLSAALPATRAFGMDGATIELVRA